MSTGESKIKSLATVLTQKMLGKPTNLDEFVKKIRQHNLGYAYVAYGMKNYGSQDAKFVVEIHSGRYSDRTMTYLKIAEFPLSILPPDYSRLPMDSWIGWSEQDREHLEKYSQHDAEKRNLARDKREEVAKKLQEYGIEVKTTSW